MFFQILALVVSIISFLLAITEWLYVLERMRQIEEQKRKSLMKILNPTQEEHIGPMQFLARIRSYEEEKVEKGDE